MLPVKTCLHVFLTAVRFLCVLKHVSMPFFATIRFLHLLKHVSMSLLCCRMVGRMFLRGLLLLPRRPQYPLLWRHRIPAPPTGGTRPPPSQSAAYDEPIHDQRHAATPSTTGGPTYKLWICARPPHHPLSLPPGGTSSPPLPPNGG